MKKTDKKQSRLVLIETLKLSDLKLEKEAVIMNEDTTKGVTASVRDASKITVNVTRPKFPVLIFVNVLVVKMLT